MPFAQDSDHEFDNEDGALPFENSEPLVTSDRLGQIHWGQKLRTSRPSHYGDTLFGKGSVSLIRVATTSERGSLMLVAQCLSPVLNHIGSFLADRPQNIVRPFLLSSRWLAEEAAFCMDGLWEQLYFERWPAFHDAFSFNGVKDWRRLYDDMIDSRCRCTLEVFEREKKLGFDMAAMPAVVSYDGGTNTYSAKYISASEVDAEIIPHTENHRLRFCPISARQQLQPFHSDREGRPRCRSGPQAKDKRRSNWLRSLSGLLSTPATSGRARTRHDDLPLRNDDLAQVTCTDGHPSSDIHPSIQMDRTAYPYKVLEGFETLVIGSHVELQWKMQELSPFGWWFGHLESLQSEPNSKTAVATITFPHFPEYSSWYRLKVSFGDSKIRPCSFGGFTGGIRPVDDSERDHWMRFVPQSKQNVAKIHHRLLRNP
jgi:hypothetical protein